MADKQEKEELEMEEFETWEDPPFEILPPGAIEKAWEERELHGPRERTPEEIELIIKIIEDIQNLKGNRKQPPEEREWVTKFLESLRNDLKRARERSNKEKEQNK